MVLLLYVGSFAWNTKGLVDCNGLFLLDMDDRLAQGFGCLAMDSTHAENWTVQAGYGFLGFDAEWMFNGESDLYTWDIDADNFLNLGFASVEADFRHLDFRLDVATLPFFKASTHWYTLDSLFFAGAYVGRGQIDSLSVKWESAADYDFVPLVNGSFSTEFVFRGFELGSKWNGFQANVDFSYGNTKPMVEREGYVFSDSSKFWDIGAGLTYRDRLNEFSISYAYVYADLNLFALLRETNSEKRFFFLPIGVDFNLLHAGYVRHSADRNSDAKFSVRATLAQLDLNIPWEERRFYETLAPNRALTGSIIKTLSFSVYTRNFRLYGTGKAQLAHLGGGYDWDLLGGAWHFKPSASLDLFYIKGDIDLRNRMETSNVLFAEHTTDTLCWKAGVAGSQLNLGFGIESPHRRFFASVSLSQLIPFYYTVEKYPKEPEPEIIVPVDPSFVPEEVPVEDEEEEESTLDKLWNLLGNGLVVGAKIGLFF